MGLTILFGDRDRKSTVEEIARRAREVVDSVLGQHGRGSAPAERPVWHSVAMQIECGEEAEYARLLSAIESNCAQRQVAIMGVHRA